MPRRQQRTSGQRRTATNIRGVQYASIDWVWADTVGNVAEFRLELNDGLTIGTVEGLTLQGVPQMWCSAGSTTPNAASIVGTSLFLTWGIAPVAGSTFRMPANDLALRGRFGEFLSMATKFTPLPFVPPLNNTAVYWTHAGFNLELTDLQEGGASFVNSVPNFYNVTQSDPAVRVSVSSNIIYVEFGSLLNSGDQIDYTQDSNYLRNITGGGMQSQTWFMP